MQSHRNRLRKINILLILIYFVSTILVIFQVDFIKKTALATVIISFTLFLIYVVVKDLKNKDKYKEPLYYYFFLLIVIATVYLSDSYNSILFPSIFIIPFLYSVINFTRRESIGVTMFILASMWLILMADANLNKICSLLFATIAIVFVQIILELLKKEYRINKKRLVNNYRVCIKENME